ncbi:TPA: porphyrin biosynthesis protein [Escherichia coli]|uniref:AAA family ATPase n=1 Tax=Escherichia marmotae TaxID=1499973 RepID=UPI00176BC492|nr:AAA family ATPase [Escherichia marmotae]EEX2905660.1 porphyrin biosynthesis protein [Escherichia coli]EFB6209033.1 AAA domain-containing protein [Escherichia coli]EFB8489957.1 AAA domain-containing protein [Escherichia coli]EFB8530450.1 AAA domain-containing protein [Escherichia coli]EFB8545389.1 AAA domain-containing protein [Escherichia coli]
MTTTALQNEKNPSDYLVCKWCGKSFHYFKSHVANGNCEGIPESVKDADPDTVLKMYTTQFPDEPTLSKKALDAIQAKRAEQKSEMAKSSGVTSSPGYTGTVEYKTDLVAAHELLNVTVKELGTKRGTPLMVSVNVNTPFPEFVPEVKKGYVYGDFELIKDIFMMLELGIPGYLWGHAGTGKSSLPTQLCALLNRPLIRAQHTASMEEAHVTGQILARDGSTYFEPGLLALAMKHGWVYLADEYDFAFPQILGVYQPVLEGEALVIKEATPEWRRITPHERFAFIGTGNTNGSGDETGLYQGTNIQNAANFSRFGIVSNVKYMSKEAEINMLINAGIVDEYAEKMVKFAGIVRDGYEEHNISQPIGPRELLLSAKIGMMRGDFVTGIERSFINKLPSASAQAAREVVQKIFG